MAAGRIPGRGREPELAALIEESGRKNKLDRRALIDLDRRIHVKPSADLTGTDIVQVLTEPHADLRAATR